MLLVGTNFFFFFFFKFQPRLYLVHRMGTNFFFSKVFLIPANRYAYDFFFFCSKSACTICNFKLNIILGVYFSNILINKYFLTMYISKKIQKRYNKEIKTTKKKKMRKRKSYTNRVPIDMKTATAVQCTCKFFEVGFWSLTLDAHVAIPTGKYDWPIKGLYGMVVLLETKGLKGIRPPPHALPPSSKSRGPY